jgi:hypothetical protein
MILIVTTSRRTGQYKDVMQLMNRYKPLLQKDEQIRLGRDADNGSLCMSKKRVTNIFGCLRLADSE